MKHTIYLQELGHRCKENDCCLVTGILEGPVGETTVLWGVEDERGIGVRGIDYCPFCAMRLPDTLTKAQEALKEDGP